MVDESGHVVPAPRSEKGPKPKAVALDFEAESGEKSAQRIAQERGHALIKHAASWSELHRNLAAVGLRFEKKGSGAIIFVGAIPVKASSVDRTFSMGNLCKRLGEFEPGEYGPLEPITPEPVSTAHEEDWKEYRRELDKDSSSMLTSDHRNTQRREAASQEENYEACRHKLERKRLARRLAGKPLTVINKARQSLAVKQREERRALAAPRPGSGNRRQSFKTWLKARGRHQQAEIWRYRNRKLPAPITSSPTTTDPGEARAAYAAHREAQHKQNAKLAALVAGMALFGKTLTTPPESSSRQDARTAVLMRAEGFSHKAVTEVIRHHAPEWCEEEKRDWSRYAARTAAYAFGLCGDLELACLPRKGQQPVKMPPHQNPPREEAQRETLHLRMR
jgi:hypothetical protein